MLAQGLLRIFPALVQDCFGYHLYRKHDAKSNQDEIIQVSQNSKKVRDLVYWTEGISDHAGSEYFGVPGHSGVFAGQVQSVGLDFQLSDSAFPSLHIHR